MWPGDVNGGITFFCNADPVLAAAANLQLVPAIAAKPLNGLTFKASDACELFAHASEGSACPSAEGLNAPHLHLWWRMQPFIFFFSDNLLRLSCHNFPMLHGTILHGSY